MSAEGQGPRNDLPSISVRRPVLAIVMNVIIILAGIGAYLGIEVRELPQVERPVVTVRVDYPGASPQTMDAEVTRALEGAVARVPGLKSIRSSSEENNARMYLEFDPSVDINNAANDVREAVNEVRRRLPNGVDNLVVVKASDEDDPIIRLSVVSDSLSVPAMTRLVEDQVVVALQRVPGVAEVRINGNRKRTLYVVIDPKRLASYGIGLDAVAAALKGARLDVPAGSFDSAEQTLLVRADASVIRERDIERIFIGKHARIGDIATVHYGPAEATSMVRFNGRPVVGLGVIRQAQANTIAISDGVQAAVKRLNERLRQIQVIKTSDDATFIRGSISEVLLTLGLGIGIVVLVMLVFFGSPRLALIPALTIPVSLIGTLAGIWAMGFSINILTLLALVLATGLVVDDAIVVLENIERRRAEGKGRLAAAVLGTRQVFFAVIATTVTLISVFIPIAFLPGRTGQLFTEFGFTLAIAVGISSFTALSLCPMLGSRLVGDGGTRRPNLVQRPFLAVGRLAERLYGRTLAAALRAPILVCGLALIGAGLMATLFANLQQELVPREDRGVLLVSLQGPDGANLDYSDRQVRKVEAILKPLVDKGEATGILSIVGRWDPNRGFVIAPLVNWGERRSQQEIVRSLRGKLSAIPGARVRIRQPNSLGIRTGGAGLEFAVTGTDYAKIAQAGDKLIAALEKRAPEMTGLRLDYSTTQPQLGLKIDRERAADLGIDINGIATALKAMVEGTEVTELNVEDQAVPVRIESKAGAVDDTDDLRNLYVRTKAGQIVPLSSLVKIKETGVAGELDRHSQRRAIEVDADLTEGVSLGTAVARLKQVAAQTLPAGTELLLLRQALALEESSNEILLTFAIALLIVLLVLAAQFESFASAVVVMITVPFGLAAAGLSLWL
ncbi:MAG: efflux RND transporter permease subunit, partial [Bauldia litoralis]